MFSNLIRNFGKLNIIFKRNQEKLYLQYSTEKQQKGNVNWNLNGMQHFIKINFNKVYALEKEKSGFLFLSFL